MNDYDKQYTFIWTRYFSFLLSILVIHGKYWIYISNVCHYCQLFISILQYFLLLCLALTHIGTVYLRALVTVWMIFGHKAIYSLPEMVIHSYIRVNLPIIISAILIFFWNREGKDMLVWCIQLMSISCGQNDLIHFS